MQKSKLEFDAVSAMTRKTQKGYNGCGAERLFLRYALYRTIFANLLQRANGLPEEEIRRAKAAQIGLAHEERGLFSMARRRRLLRCRSIDSSGRCSGIHH
jgi:hypothetical protein